MKYVNTSIRLIIAIYLTTLLVLGCSNLQDYREVLYLDKKLTLVESSDGDLYFRSKATLEECGIDYYYNNSVLRRSDRVLIKIDDIIDPDSLKLIKVNRNQYYLEDENNIYLVLLHLCDNTSSFSVK